MRRRKCKGCGAEFLGQGDQHLCPDCRKAARQGSVIRERTCSTCGGTFPGGPRARYCPRCREERREKAKLEYKQRKSAGSVRKIGSKDICQVCGREYTVRSGLQKYCPDCAEEAVQQNVLPRKRARAAGLADERKSRKKQLREGGTICAYCGRAFTPINAAVTCSENCAREHNRIVSGLIDYRRGKRKAPPPAQRYDSGLPQSGLAGVTYNRQRGKWQVVHNGNYIGLFPSKEEAEHKKRELQGDT